MKACDLLRIIRRYIVGIEVWSEGEDDLDLDNTAPHRTTENFLITWLANFLLRLQSRHFMPDVALDALLKFIYIFLVVLGRFSDICKSLSHNLSQSLYSLKKFLGLKDKLEQLAVCPKCNSIYPIEKCIDRPGVSKPCGYKEFPNSRKCDFILLKTVELASRKRIMYPNSVYCYNSLRSCLELLFSQSDFPGLCEQWKSRQAVTDCLSDIYDGGIWKDFQVVSGQPFLAERNNLAFSLNVDWFQPYKLTQSSVGVVYLTVLNLPRSIRNAQRYTLLIGIIPGPHEPRRDINSFLRPLVDELKLLWVGQYIKIPSISESQLQLVRGAILCVACDLPASKKVAGFLGHTAKLGCSKCLKRFPGGFGNTDYSGFDRNLWPPRTNSGHRAAVEETKKCMNKTSREKKNLSWAADILFSLIWTTSIPYEWS